MISYTNPANTQSQNRFKKTKKSLNRETKLHGLNRVKIEDTI